MHQSLSDLRLALERVEAEIRQVRCARRAQVLQEIYDLMREHGLDRSDLRPTPSEREQRVERRTVRRSPYKTRKAGFTLPRGVLPRDCVTALAQRGELRTPEVLEWIVAHRGIRFAHGSNKLGFASAVAMALRSCERRGLVEVAGRDEKTRALKWRIRLDDRTAARPA